MKAVQITGYGGVETLELRDLPDPVAGSGEVVVKIHAAGVNPFDAKIRAGWLARFYPINLPATAGADFAGEVIAVGEGVSRIKLGDRVYGFINPLQGGSYAEQIGVNEHLVRLMPKGLSFAEAAALPMAGQTALYALTTLGGVKPGQRVLIHGASGGVGGYAVQLAKALGATVYATCAARNVERVRKFGADHVIDYTTTDFRTVAHDIDLAIDPIGNETNLQTYEVMKPGGVIAMVLLYNPTEMEHREALSAKYKVTVKPVMFDNEPELLDRLRDVIEAHGIDANIARILPLADAGEAQALAASGHAGGKIVLDVAGQQ